MQDTTTTLPDTGQTPDNSTPWSTHPGYDLSRYTVVSDAVNDRDSHHPGTVSATVSAEKFTGRQNACVRINLCAGPADMQVRMSPEKARDIAQAILDAADIVDAFEAFTAVSHHPINTAQRVVEVAKGCFAFEPATAGEGGAA